MDLNPFFVTVLVILIDFTTAASIKEMTSNVGGPSLASLMSWPVCRREIYCSGELLHDVQLMNLFKDSKIFVDFKLRYPEKEIVLKYKELKAREHGFVNRTRLKQFIEENFERGNELEAWVPTDWKREPKIIQKIMDPNFKKWVSYLNTMWRVLARRVKDDVEIHPERYSLIFVPNGFIIPGGRFTELYYWDTFWIINGLLLCDMAETCKGIIENLIHLVKLFGHVPNGSRVYYISRSQPPLLIQMVQSYYKSTNDWGFVQNNIQYFEQEFNYWWDNHMVTITQKGRYFKLARYFSYDLTPRPESYREDYLVAHDMPEIEDREDFYIKIRSAAETGWDFSSRWFVRNKTNEGNLSDISTPQIVPVDLNSFLHSNAEILSEWFNKLGDPVKAKLYKTRAEALLDAISMVLWHDSSGMWFDYDCVNKIRRDYFYASNLTPLFTRSYPRSWSRVNLSDNIIDYLRLHNLEDIIGGIPTSLEQTGEQWDFPNNWAPLQAIIVQGLEKLGTDDAVEEAYKLAEKWIHAVYKGYKTGHTMFEKYDVLRPGQSGEGGEYVPQTGFGWTNGVVLEFLNKYGDKFESFETEDTMEWFQGAKRHKNVNAVSASNNNIKKCRLNDSSKNVVPKS